MRVSWFKRDRLARLFVVLVRLVVFVTGCIGIALGHRFEKVAKFQPMVVMEDVLIPNLPVNIEGLLPASKPQRVNLGEWCLRIRHWNYSWDVDIRSNQLITGLTMRLKDKFVSLRYKLIVEEWEYLQRRSLARVLEHNRHQQLFPNLGKPADAGGSYPGPLINSKVMVKFIPLQTSNDSVSNSKEDANELNNRFPPLKGLIPLCFGFVGGLWGWINLREGRRLPTSGIVFVSAVACIFCGWWFVLRWLAG